MGDGHDREGERLFLLDITENQGQQVNMAAGWTADLAENAAALCAVLEHPERLISEIVPRFPFLELKPFAISWERGTFVEDHWRSYLDEEPVAPAPVDERSARAAAEQRAMVRLVEVAYERPDLRRRMPFTSLGRFSVRAEEPSANVPVIAWLEDERYALVDYGDPTPTFLQLFPRSQPGYLEHFSPLAEGSASVVVDALEERLRAIDSGDPGPG
jgi:hypothetical protein